MAKITPRQRKRDGKTVFMIEVSNGYNAKGKQVTIHHTFVSPTGLTGKKLEKEVQRQAQALEDKVHNGQMLDESMKMDELIDMWFERYVDKKCKPKTATEYRYLKPRISQGLGHLKVSQIKAVHIMDFYSTLEETGARRDSIYIATPSLLDKLPRGKRKEAAEEAEVCGRCMTSICSGQGVSYSTAQKVANAVGMPFSKAFRETPRKNNGKLKGSTIKHYHRMLSSIFSKAVQWDIVKDNPVKRAEAPHEEKAKIRYLEEKDAARLLACLNDAPPQYSAIVQLCLFTGMRRGETCALRWSDIDFEKSTISVQRTIEVIPHLGTIFVAPKTEKSSRTIKVGKNCLDLLREHHKWQIQERIKLGSEWVRTVAFEDGIPVGNDLLFTRWNGAPIDIAKVTTWFPKFLREHDLPIVSIHSLRHTNASLQIAEHIPITTVAGRLGHAQTSTTTDIYAEFIRSADAAASDTMEEVFNRIRAVKVG